MDLHKLIDQLRQGEKTAGPILVSIVAPSLTGYVNTIGSDLSVADRELTLEIAIEKAVDKIDQFDESRGSFPGWARTFVRHAVADQRQKKFTGNPDIELDNLPSPPDFFDDESDASNEELGALSRALAAISATDQLILGLRYGERLTHAEIGKILVVSEAASRKRAARALSRLREVAKAEEVLVAHMGSETK